MLKKMYIKKRTKIYNKHIKETSKYQKNLSYTYITITNKNIQIYTKLSIEETDLKIINFSLHIEQSVEEDLTIELKIMMAPTRVKVDFCVVFGKLMFSVLVHIGKLLEM